MTHLLSILPQTPLEITTRGAPQSTRRAPTFAIYTLGCKVNQADSTVLARSLNQKGFRRVAFKDSADLYVIDTCTVTSEADKKSRKAAARATRNNPDALVAVTGCAATYAAEKFHRVAPDALVLSNARKFELPELALQRLRARQDWGAEYSRLREETASEPVFISTPTRAVLKIQDGCNHNCSYCIIPTVRGASTLKSRASILEEASTLLAEGAREIIVTGVSMGDFSSGGRRQKAAGRNGSLCDLLRELSTLDGLQRLRVSSLDPADVDEEYLQTIANTPKICPHIHLALQSGSASTLRRMRRRYTPQLFLEAAKRWREIAPDGGLTTDIIVGFPGESDNEFQESVRVAREAKFCSIHVFPYSPREGTAAAQSGKLAGSLIDPITQNHRMQELLAVAEELSTQFATRFVGRTVPVLIEQIGDTFAEGLTENYLRVRVGTVKNFAIGDVIDAHVESWSNGALQVI